MKKLSVAFAAVLAAGAVTVGAGTARAQSVEPYQIEAALFLESESSDDTDMNIIGLGGQYAFKSVDPGTGPLNEAVFLARVPWASASVGMASGTADIGAPSDADITGTMISIGGSYADPNVPVRADLSYSMGDIKLDAGAGNEATADMTMLGVKAGYFVMPNLVAGVSYGLDTTKIESGGATVMEGDTTSIGVVGKWVQELAGGSAINAELGFDAVTDKVEGVSGDHKANVLSLVCDYYFTQLIGAGVALEMEAGEDSDDDSTTIGARFMWNLNTTLGATVSYDVTSYEASGVDDTTTLGVSVIGRF
jgi:hypothetical protein